MCVRAPDVRARAKWPHMEIQPLETGPNSKLKATLQLTGMVPLEGRSGLLSFEKVADRRLPGDQ